MLPIESEWIGNNLINLSSRIRGFRLLNIGSSTGYFRSVQQPHVYKNIFHPLESNSTVEHLDMKDAEGVDLVGDLTDPDFLSQLVKRNYDAVLCSNLLEHVANRSEICSCMERCLKSGGYLVVTVPNLHPFHNDPIDTMFRPTIEKLASLFSASDLIEGVIIRSDDTHFKVLVANPELMFKTVVRWFLPFYQFDHWKKVVSDIPDTFTRYRVACVLLRKR